MTSRLLHKKFKIVDYLFDLSAYIGKSSILLIIWRIVVHALSTLKDEEDQRKSSKLDHEMKMNKRAHLICDQAIDCNICTCIHFVEEAYTIRVAY